ncbi:MAG: hypothetical protein ACTSW1_02565 [Candidatus Hodarchaeales archaeon]
MSDINHFREKRSFASFSLTSLSVKRIKGRRTEAKIEMKEQKLRAVRIELKPTKQLRDWCFRAKNLYNVATYIVRQEFFHNSIRFKS